MLGAFGGIATGPVHAASPAPQPVTPHAKHVARGRPCADSSLSRGNRNTYHGLSKYFDFAHGGKTQRTQVREIRNRDDRAKDRQTTRFTPRCFVCCQVHNTRDSCHSRGCRGNNVMLESNCCGPRAGFRGAPARAASQSPPAALGGQTVRPRPEPTEPVCGALGHTCSRCLAAASSSSSRLAASASCRLAASAWRIQHSGS